MPKISILTPFKNCEKYIYATALSILAQTESDWEWILVDDHSDENEAEMLSEFLNDSRIKILKNKGNGIISALETAFAQVKGEFCTRMDADDVMPENKLSLFANYLLQNPNSDLVTGKVRYFSDDYEVSEPYRKYEAWLNSQVDKNDFYSQIYRECTLSSGNWMMRTSTLRAIGGFAQLNYPEDYDLLFRWYENKLTISGIDEITHHWREHANRTSRTSKNYQQIAFFELKIKRFLQLDWKNETIFLNGTGQKGRIVAKILIQEKVPFYWFSHEAEKYLKGIFDVPILSPRTFILDKKIFFLNSTLIPEISLFEKYGITDTQLIVFQL